MNLAKFLLTAVLISACIKDIFALHQTGASIEYKLTPLQWNKFRIEGELFLSRDYNSQGAKLDDYIELAAYKKSNGKWFFIQRTICSLKKAKVYSIYPENQYCYYNDFLAFIEIGTYSFSMELDRLDTEIMIVHQRCCRINNHTNVINSGDGGIAIYCTLTPRGQNTAHISSKINFERYFGIMIESKDSIQLLNGANLNFSTLIEWATPFTAGAKAGSLEMSGSPFDCNGITPDPYKCPPPFVPINFKTGCSAQKPMGPFGDIELDSQRGSLNIQSLSVTGNFLMGFEITTLDLSGKKLGNVYCEMTLCCYATRRSLYKFSGYRFWDKNHNFILDSSEPKFSFPIELKGDHCLYTPYPDGFLNLVLFKDSTTIIKSTSNIWQITPASINSFPVFSSLPDTVIYSDIPFEPVESISEATLTGLLESNRCNTNTRYLVNFTNTGSTSLRGKIYVQLDTNYKLLSLNIPYSIEGSQYTIDLGHIEPLQSADSIIFDLQGPHENNTNRPVRFVCSFISPGYSVSHTYESIILCAFDPNSKSNIPYDGKNNLIEKSQPLIYTIEFENLGNDTAHSVVIKDQIGSKIDLSSFKFISSSHPCYYFITKDRTIWFVHDPISLIPSKSDPKNSKGYVRFKINPYPDLRNKDVIDNSAEIIFDSNQPIKTNNTYNLFSTFFTNRQNRDELSKILIPYSRVYPNPFDQYIYVDNPHDILISEEVKLTLYNAYGKLLINRQAFQFNDALDLSYFSDGVYFLALEFDGKIPFQQKLIKCSH